MFTVSDFKQPRLSQDDVQEIIQQVLTQAFEQGFAKGLAEALERIQSLIKQMLTRKIGELPIDLIESLQTLSFEQLADLGEALFDFEQPADLATWLTENIGNDEGDRPNIVS